MDWMQLQRLAAEEAAHGPRAGPRAGSEAGPASGAGDPAALLEGLNPEQRAAATHPGGALLILAGPGSGKTRVITRRIAWLVATGRAQAWEIAAITFTNKAAREMRERVEQLLPARGAWISTFHAFCARLLRREIELLGTHTRDFTIYDTSEKNQLIKNLVKELGYDATRFRPALLGGWISARKNRGREAFEAAAEAQAEEQGIEAEVLQQVERRYAAALARNNALDFDDLLLQVLALFERQPGVRDAYARRFRHVLVDEYQDTNRVQYEIARHLASHHHNLAVCGDPDQSIYSWRGADIRNILEFGRDNPAARTVRLEQNYRSTGNILRAAEALIRNNAGRQDKRIWSDKPAGEPILVCECADEEDEAREVALQVRALQARGQRLDGIAVFYRVNFMQRALESALRLARVPYQIVGGLEFYDRREIRDLIAYLKLIVNRRDDLAFRRVVNVPTRGIGEKSLEQFSAWAAARGLPLSEALLHDEALAAIKGRARGGLQAFRELLVRLEPAQGVDAAVALDLVLGEIGVERWLGEMDDESGVDREANIEELRAHAAAWDRMSSELARALAEVETAGTTASATDGAPDADRPPTGLRGYLQEIALVNDTDALDAGSGKVTLMTLHSAKGLEFPVVFLCGVEEELLPHARALQENTSADPEAGVEEERRLFYVGITRAEERLFLTHCQQRLHFGQTSFCSPSRFLDELPKEVLAGGASDGAGDQDDGGALGVYEPKTPDATFTEGERVEHDHFGRGTIVRLQGSGINARATVRFPAHGEKILLLQYAKLRRVAKG